MKKREHGPPPISPAATNGGPEVELGRFHELLDPLIALETSGSDEIPQEEQAAWKQAIEALDAGASDPITLEECLSCFARTLWSASAAAMPPARIADTLVRWVRAWPEDERHDALALAERFAQRSLSIDQGGVIARGALARAAILSGDLAAAEKAVSQLPGGTAGTLAIRAEIHAARGRRSEAIEVRERQLATGLAAPADRREARLHLARLLVEDGKTDKALPIYRETVAEFPDHAAARHAFARALHAGGHMIDAVAELESAILLGDREARATLDAVVAEIDSSSLARFRRLLLSGRDGDPLPLTSAAAS